MREIEGPQMPVPKWYQRRVALCKVWHVPAVFAFCVAIHLFVTAAVGAEIEPALHVVAGVQLLLVVGWLLLAFWPAKRPKHEFRMGVAVATLDDGRQDARVVAGCRCGWRDDPAKSARADTADAADQAQNAWSVHVALEEPHDECR